MSGNRHTLDERVKDEVLHYPTVDLIRLLFPGVRMRGRTVLCNPLREDRNPSMSCFRDRHGVPRWKDFSTGETGDNIDFFRKVYPDLGYAEAVDRLAVMVLGRGAFEEEGVRPASSAPVRRAARVPSVEPAPVLSVVSDIPFLSAGTPEHLVSYVRSRGISDDVSSRDCRCVVFENTRVSGMMRRDPLTGQPFMGPDGTPERLDGRSAAVALPNDIGGFSLRVPAGGGSRGFKGCNTAFVSTLLADGAFPAGRVGVAGEGDWVIGDVSYDAQGRLLWFNGSQAFTGVEPWAARFSVPYFSSRRGRTLEGRDLRGACAVLDAMNGPVNTVATVVEGMFDALSVIELQRILGRGTVPGTDLVVLNSVTNLSWSVPFLAMHSEVRSLLDNDLRSAAGQKTYSLMAGEVRSYAALCGAQCRVKSNSALFRPYKDVNDYLRASLGLGEVIPGAAREQKKKRVSPAGKGMGGPRI